MAATLHLRSLSNPLSTLHAGHGRIGERGRHLFCLVGCLGGSGMSQSTSAEGVVGEDPLASCIGSIERWHAACSGRGELRTRAGVVRVTASEPHTRYVPPS